MTNIITIISSLTPFFLLINAASIRNNAHIRYGIRTATTLIGVGTITALSVLWYLLANGENELLYAAIPGNTLSFRFDSVSTIMFAMVSVIGLVVLKFSENYLGGDQRQFRFIRRLLATIASVEILILSGSLLTLFLSWVSTSICLQSLIVFYKDRPEARMAGRKKFIIARMSDVALLISFYFLYSAFGTGDLKTIFETLKYLEPGSLPLNLEISAVFLVLAAIIKSVQIPFHGWILEVLEAPTPVSGILHAGLLNAGPFLVIRFAHLMDLSTYGSAILLVLGGLSALYGTIVYPAQPSVKTGLVYSSIGHMGFSLMICGMGLYAASLLHLIAHSFYKAHAFLSSGSAVDKRRLSLLKGDTTRNPSLWNILPGFLFSGILYVTIISLTGTEDKHQFQHIMLGVIIVTGVSSYMVRAASFRNGVSAILKSTFISGMVLLTFFISENTMVYILSRQIPEAGYADGFTRVVGLILMIVYIITAFSGILTQSILNDYFLKWEVYKRNGFYIHTVFDRFLKTLQLKISK